MNDLFNIPDEYEIVSVTPLEGGKELIVHLRTKYNNQQDFLTKVYVSDIRTSEELREFNWTIEQSEK